MKRLFSLMVIMSVLLGISVVYSQEANPTNKGKFTYGGLVRLYGYYESTVVDIDERYATGRFRQYFTYKKGNVKTVLKLEIDPTLGENGTGVYSSFIDWDADQKAIIEVKNAYLEFLLFKKLTVKAGIFGAKAPGDLIYIHDVPGVDFGIKLNDIAINLTWIKPVEGDVEKWYDDEDYLSLQANIPLGSNFTIMPGYILGISQGFGDTNTPVPQRDPAFADHIFEIAFSGNINPLFFNFAFAFGIGNDTMITNVTPKSGFTGSLDVGVKIKPLTIKAIVFMSSGDNTNTTSKEEMTGFSIYNKGFFPMQTPYFQASGDSLFMKGIGDMKADGVFSFGLDVGAKLLKDDALALNLIGAYFLTMNNSGNAYGAELSLLAGYTIIDKLSLYLQVSGFFEGNYYGAANNNRFAVAVGPKYSW